MEKRKVLKKKWRGLGPAILSFARTSQLASRISDASSEKQHDHDDQHKTQATTRVVSPGAAVWPRWKRSKQHQDQQHKKNCEHCVSPFLISSRSDPLPGCRLLRGRRRRWLDLAAGFLALHRIFLYRAEERFTGRCGIHFSVQNV